MLHHSPILVCELTLRVNGKTDKKMSAMYFHMWDARLSNVFPFKPQIARRWQLCVSRTFLTALKFSPLILSKLSNPWNEMSFWSPRSAQPRWQTDTITRFLKRIQYFTCSAGACAAHQRRLTSTNEQFVQNMIQMAVVSTNWKVQMELWYFKNLNFILWKSVLTLLKSLEIFQVRSLSQQSEMGTAERPRSKICMRWSDALTTHLDGDSHSKLTSQDFRAKTVLGEDSCFRLNTDDFTGIFQSAAVRSFLRNMFRNLK